MRIPRHFDYTAYGDTINTTARLEIANKQLGTRICVSESVVSRCSEFQGRPVGDLMLRGRAEPIRAYEPLLPEAFSALATANYLDAFRGFHLRRLLNGATGATIVLD